LASAPRGDGHPVLVLPGMLASDRSTGVLRTYLANLGYEVHKWELGRNLGARAIGVEGERLIERLSTIHRANGRKVSLIGWSLGGAFAQLLGRRLPEHVRSVITLGSPLRGDPRASNVWRIYEMATGDRVDSVRTTRQRDEIAAPPEVPTTAIFSKADGVVPWWNCQVTEGPTAENVEVYGSHCGLGVNAAALYVIADRLAQKPGEWRRFAPMALAAPLYPRARAS
ncbi:MAG: alpha/beta hydrolase, partial [Sphingomonadaceae bacterium]|nr:alpha/beta hydrolase [Sphingomonadaceae bacterium]